MKKASKKVVLHAGNYCFENAGTHVHTLLGSCVSITLFHPIRKIGGMCHFALPYNIETQRSRLNPRYGDDCMTLFLRSIKRTNTQLKDYQAKIFGGGNMYEKHPVVDFSAEQTRAVGEKNVVAAFSLLTQHNIDIQVAHVGEFGYRRIVFDVTTGEVWVKFVPNERVKGDQRSLTGRT